jgi:predicted nuclease of predicted toxin-antitoxin system
MARAELEGRVLLTEDKDFGRLLYAEGHTTCGVIFIRFPGDARAALAQAVLDLCQQHGDALPASFAVLEPGKVRISRLPRR